MLGLHALEFGSTVWGFKLIGLGIEYRVRDLLRTTTLSHYWEPPKRNPDFGKPPPTPVLPQNTHKYALRPRRARECQA